MKTKISLVIVVLIVLGTLLSACNRPASEAPAATPTEGFPFPLSTQGVSQFATQTAAAKQPAVITATPKPGTNPTQPAKTVSPATAVPGTPEVQPTEQPVQKPTEKPAVIPTLTRPEKYTIQQGEFPYCIARRFDLNIADLMSLNGLSIDARPAVGTTLKIPQSGAWSGERALASHPTTYTVLANDSIGSIACKFGDVSPEAILAANGMKNASEIQAGQKLQIP